MAIPKHFSSAVAALGLNKVNSLFAGGVVLAEGKETELSFKSDDRTLKTIQKMLGESHSSINEGVLTYNFGEKQIVESTSLDEEVDIIEALTDEYPHSKAHFNSTLKEKHRVENISMENHEDKNVPIRDYDDKMQKGIHLRSVSPMDVTSAGRERGEKVKNSVIDTLKNAGYHHEATEWGAHVITGNKGTKKEFKVHLDDREHPAYTHSAGYDRGYKNHWLEIHHQDKPKKKLDESADHKFTEDEVEKVHSDVVHHMVNHEGADPQLYDTSHSVITQDPESKRTLIHMKSAKGDHGAYEFERGEHGHPGAIQQHPPTHPFSDHIVGGVDKRGDGYVS